jgi:drug/metabolite transporter (DMT)-like permease
MLMKPPALSSTEIPLTVWLMALISVSLSALGQYLMKTAMSGPAIRTALGEGVLTGAVKAAGEPFLIAGLACYGFSMLLWLLCLSRMPLTVAYPLVSLSLVLVIGLATAFGGEKVSGAQFVGIALIIGGVLLVGRR